MRMEEADIVIREAVLSDAKTLNAWWNDGQVMEHAGFPNGLGQSMEETIKNIELTNNGNRQLCMIEIAGIPVGELSYQIKSDERAAYTGWKICDPEYQNKGYGPRIIVMLFHFLFTDKKINALKKIEHILWDTTLENKRAQHVYECKIGATKTRIQENAWRDQTGKWRTSVNYEMSREAFYALHGQLTLKG